jgi:hypothetical protein
MRRRALTAATFVLVAASLAVAVMEGVPSRLPGVALGSPVLLQAERALATVGALKPSERAGTPGSNGQEGQAEQPQSEGQDNNGNPNNSSRDGRVPAGRGVAVASAAGGVYGTWEDSVSRV